MEKLQKILIGAMVFFFLLGAAALILLLRPEPEAAAAAVKSAEITAAMSRVRQRALCEARFLSPVR